MSVAWIHDGAEAKPAPAASHTPVPLHDPRTAPTTHRSGQTTVHLDTILVIERGAGRDKRVGEDADAATVAAILQRAEHIKSPGGYLRTLVERKGGGQFSLGPVLQALSRVQLGGERHAAKSTT